MKMKLLLVLGLFSVFSCSNDLNLVSPYKDIPVVYGIISLPDTEQFIRIEKGFVDPVTSALEIAMNPDSLYYQDAAISILEESTGQQFNLTKVDGTEYGFDRDPGVFATDPNYLYKTEENEFTPIAGETYTLQIQRNADDELVTASTIMVEEPKIVRPSTTGSSSLDFNYSQNTILKWNGNQTNGLYDVVFVIHYRERRISDGGDFVNKSFRWNVVSNYDEEEFEMQGIGFYGAMSSNLEVDSDFDRRFRFIDMILAAGGEEIKEYVRIGQANSGLTSSQDIPVYTNISEGRGLFSSKQETINEGIAITVGTLDSLAEGQFTKDLNFKN